MNPAKAPYLEAIESDRWNKRQWGKLPVESPPQWIWPIVTTGGKAVSGRDRVI